MAKIDIEIADLESILTNLRADHAPEEIQDMENDLRQFRYIQALWNKFKSAPVGQDGLLAKPLYFCDENDVTVIAAFPIGSSTEGVQKWFEQRFAISCDELFGETDATPNTPAANPASNPAPLAINIAALPFMLIEVIEREIQEPMFFPTHEAAEAHMRERFKEMADVTDEEIAGLDNDSGVIVVDEDVYLGESFACCEDYGQNYDWRIFDLTDPDCVAMPESEKA